MAVDHPTQKVALVTGVTRGTGEEIARRLLRGGFKVYVGSPAIHTVLGLFGSGVIPVALDTESDDDIIAVVGRICEAYGGVDLLVNYTGAFRRVGTADIPSDERSYRFEHDLMGLSRVVKLLLPGMSERGRGRIVNVSSAHDLEKAGPGDRRHAYRYALEGWTDCLRIEAAPFGIDVVLVEPGAENDGFAEKAGPASGGGEKSLEAVARACEKPYEHRWPAGDVPPLQPSAGPPARRDWKRVI